MKRSLVALVLVLSPLVASIAAQEPRPRPGAEGRPGEEGRPPNDPFERYLFTPEMVMKHQGEIGLTDAQRMALQTAMKDAQGTFVAAQWKLSGEGEKLGVLLQRPTIDESQTLEQVDRILQLEREMKRAQVGLMVKIKNTLTPAQQAKLRELRDRRE
jgi:Spy/CpxP family protein refolding chaperone